MNRPILAALLAILPCAAPADEVTDALTSAIEAYEAGDVQYALEEMAFARQLMQAMKADSLAAFLPPAPEGWTRELDAEMNAGLAMMGGGTGAEARYEGPDGRFTVKLMADNPMVGAMAGMFANPMMMAAAGEIHRVGRQKYVDQSGTLITLVDNRILVQAEGAEAAAMLPLLEQIDYRALADFGR